MTQVFTMILRKCLIVVALLETKAFADFINGKPDFFPGNFPSPLAYYYLNEGSGFYLEESVSGDRTAGTVVYDDTQQINLAYDQPNWVNDEFFGKTIACGDISNKKNPTEGVIQKDTLSLKDVDYGSNGSWAWSAWFRHEKNLNFPDADREQLFGHGDPTGKTTDTNQVHVQLELDGVIRTIVGDSSDAEVPINYGVTDTDRDRLDNVGNGNWHQLILSTRKDGAKGYNVYVNGVLQASAPTGKGNSKPSESDIWLARGGEPMDPSGEIRFCGRAKPAEWYGGEEGDYAWDTNRYFRGQVAHFAVWNSALTHEEAASLYTSYYNEYDLSGQPEDKGGLGTGAVAGIVGGSIGGFVLLVGVGMYVRKGRNDKESTSNVDSDLPSVN